jgi:hypothetical protein
MMNQIPISPADNKLPFIFPFTGQLSDDSFKQLCGVLRTCFNDTSDQSSDVPTNQSSDVDFIRHKMITANPAVIMNRSSGRTYVDELKRISQRKTFNKLIVDQISDQILDDIRFSASAQRIKPDDVMIDSSHGDILYYGEGGFFGLHRDTVSRYPDEIKDSVDAAMWRMYSVLIGIDSNVSDEIASNAIPSDDHAQDTNAQDVNSSAVRTSDTHTSDTNSSDVNSSDVNSSDDRTQDSIVSCGGETEIYLPSRSWMVNQVPTERIITCDDSLRRYKKLTKHIFRESCVPAHYVVFPAEALHGSTPILKGKYKLALKLDMWLKLPRSETPIYLDCCEPFTRECTCQLCKSDVQREECFCSHTDTCPCTCEACQYDDNCNGIGPQNDSSSIDQQEDQYDECNGYEDTLYS